MLWVAQHAELLGDPVLGPEAFARFLPSRFNADGEALDARDMPCQILACPKCHLTIPRALIETTPLFVSMIGARGENVSRLVLEEAKASLQATREIGIGFLPAAIFRQRPKARQVVRFAQFLQRQIAQGSGRFANGEARMGVALDQDARQANAPKDQGQQTPRKASTEDDHVGGLRCHAPGSQSQKIDGGIIWVVFMHARR